jgi:hypothetical protein
MKKFDTKDRLHQCWNLFGSVARDAERPELIERFEPEMKRSELGLFRTVIMGEIKKGKTSFINALLGAPDLLPVASDIATSVVFKVMYGQERKFKIFFQPDIDTGKRSDPIEVTQDQLQNYGTETGNPHNEKKVDFIGVEEPNPILKEGIVIVDTPGVGGMFKAHRDVSWRYAPNADAIFFVLDSVESVLSRDEINFLKELRDRLKKQVFFVQTKIDAVDSEQFESWQNRNKSILQKEVGIPETSIQYFPISAKLKNIADESHDSELLKDSGFLTLLDFIHHELKAKKDEMLAAQLVASLAASTNEIYLDLQNQQKLLSAKNNDEINQIRQNLDKAKTEMTRWEHDTFQSEMNRFRSRFEDIKRKYRHLIQDELDPNGTLVTDFTNALYSTDDLDPRKLVEGSENLQQIWLADTAERFEQIHINYNIEVTDLVKSISQELNSTMTSFSNAIVKLDDVAGGSLITPSKIPDTFSTFEDIRTSMYGGMAGGTMATIAVGLASIVFPPAAALITIAPFIGGWFGGIWAADILTVKRREEVIAKLTKNIQVLASKILRQSLHHLDDMNVNYERKINEMFKRIVDDTRKRLEQQTEQARLTLTRTKEDNEKALKDIKARIVKVNELQKIMQSFLPSKKLNNII